MYSIDTVLIDQDILLISIYYDSIIIGRKFIGISLNEDKTPTFAESGYAYDKDNLVNFINLIEKNEFNEYSSFSFDDQDRFDGFRIIFIKTIPYLSIISNYERSSTSVYIKITEENRAGIVSDLKYLVSKIDELIDKEIKYYSFLEDPFLVSEELTNEENM